MSNDNLGEDQEAILALQRLDADAQNLDLLREMLKRREGEVDLFDALGLDGSEAFHSNFLAWLLNPSGSHGLGISFLRGFLATSGASRAIRSADLPSTTIGRERHLEIDGGRGRLDIRILNESARFLCAVENKVGSGESGDQLAWYRRVLETEYPDHRVHLVFLTPKGDKPENLGERDHWNPLTYTRVLRLVEETIETARGTANEDVLAFLRQYATTLRRNIVPEVSNDVHALARIIYRKHKQAIDLITKNKEHYEPNYLTEGFGMVRDAIGKQPRWKEARCDRPYARFVSSEWDQFGELRLDGWPFSLLVFEIRVTNQWTELWLGMASGGEEMLRRQIFEKVKRHPEVFNCAESSYNSGFFRLHTVGNILDEADYENWWDEDAIRDTIDSRLNDFAQGRFREINKIIVECLEEYRSETG